MISNDKELLKAVGTVNDCLQQIQDYLGEDNPDIGRIKLPKGYIRTVKHFRNRLIFISDKNVRKKLNKTRRRKLSVRNI